MELGYYNAFYFTIALGVSMLIAWAIQGWARRRAPPFDRGVEKGKVYLSGEDEPSNEELHYLGHHLFWGFRQALSPYYKPAKRAHSGILTDYVLWMLLVAGVVLIVMILVG
jgi:hypothetical protein